MHTSTTILSLAAAALLMGGCAQKKEPPMSSAITKAPFGQTEAGQPIELYTLKNASGMEAGVINLGGIVVSLKVPGRGGQSARKGLKGKGFRECAAARRKKAQKGANGGKLPLFWLESG